MTTEQPQVTGHAHRRDSLSDILGISGRSGSITEIASAMHPQNKRARAGSISGRLRAASDLADFGLIDMQTKGQLKDLIIAGDPALIYALEKYEKGDLSELDAIIKRAKMNRNQSIDLLEGLDFDFMNVHKLDDFNSSGLLDIDSDFLFGTEESDILKSAGGVSHNDVLDILASDNPVISSINSNVPKSTPKGRGRGRGRGRGSANAATNAGSSAPASVGEGMIDLSMYADKAVQLSSPQSKKSNVKIRAPSSSLLPPRPPRPPNIGSGNSHLATTSNSNSDPNFQYDASGSLNLQGIPIDNPPNTYPFIVHPNQVLSSHIPTNPNADGSLNQEGFIGAYSPESRRQRIQKFLEKRSRRVWTKKVKYDVRKNFADSRLRVKGRFVKKEDEEVLRDRIPTATITSDTADATSNESQPPLKEAQTESSTSHEQQEAKADNISSEVNYF